MYKKVNKTNEKFKEKFNSYLSDVRMTFFRFENKALTTCSNKPKGTSTFGFILGTK